MVNLYICFCYTFIFTFIKRNKGAKKKPKNYLMSFLSFPFGLCSSVRYITDAHFHRIFIFKCVFYIVYPTGYLFLRVFTWFSKGGGGWAFR